MSSTYRLAVTAVSLLFLAACGGGSPPRALVDAERSTLSASPASATADGAAIVTLTATARDSSGHAIPGRLAVFAVSGAATLSGSTSAMTGPEGTATTAVTSTMAGAITASAAVDGVPVTQQASATFVAGPPAAIAFTAQPAGGTAGTAFGSR